MISAALFARLEGMLMQLLVVFGLAVGLALFGL